MGYFKPNIEKERNETYKIEVLAKIGASVIISLVMILLFVKLIIPMFNDLLSTIILVTIKTIFFIMIYSIHYRKIEKIAKLKKKLNTYEEKYRFVINNTTDGLWDWNIENDKVLLPIKWKEKLGYHANEIPDTVRAWENLIHADDFDWVTESLYKYLKGEISKFDIEYRMVQKNSEVIWIHDKGHAIWDQSGKPLRMVGTHTDITIRKEAETKMLTMMEENKQLLTKTLEQERLQTEFFSNISHEFKTPLNVILGSIQLLEFYKKTPAGLDLKQIDKSVATMKQNCYRLLRLINNLLDTTKLDYNAFNITYKNYNIVHIIEEITQSAVVLAQNKGVSITFDTDVEEKIIACDVNIIERIMLNLLSNAIKYTKKEDSIFVTVKDEDDTILISVKDTGIGIPPDKIEKIFDRFMQIDGSLQRRTEGSGIGLSLIKGFIHKLNGQIWVKSREGLGSDFFVRLPAHVLLEESVELYSEDYVKSVAEQIKVEFSDIY